MAISLKSPVCLLQLKKSGSSSPLLYSRRVSAVSIRKFQPMATLSTVSTVGLSETFACLKEQGKIARHAAGNAIDKPIKGSSQVDDVLLPQEEVALIPYITAGDPDLSTTGQALKVLDSCGSDIIELGVPYSDPLADGPVIQAAATRSLARGTNFDAIIKMLKEVVPELSCPIALFSYYNPILKRGVEKFMSIINDAGVHGLVVPDVPLEETEILRKEATKYKIELVLLTTPTTPSSRMKAIVEASEGFVYLVSSVGVTGARASVSERVQTLLQDIKGATNKPVAVGFGISTPEHVKQVASWGADGVIVGSAMVKLMGEAKSPEEGLEKLESFTRSLKSALI